MNFGCSYVQLLDMMVFVIFFFPHKKYILGHKEKKKTQKMRLVQSMTKSQDPVQPRHRNMPLVGVYGNV